MTGSQSKLVLSERRANVGLLTINRPEVMNAIDEPTAAAILAAFESFDADEAVRVLVVTGAGDRAFSTGWDLREASELTATAGDESAAPGALSTLEMGLPTWKPVISAVNGYCVAEGLQMALMGDIIVAAEEARFGLPEVRRGVIGGTQRLGRAIPRHIALEWILTGDYFDAATAFRVNLVNRVVKREDLMPVALEIAGTLARRAPLALRNAKQAFYRGMHLPLKDAMDLEHELDFALLATEDAREGTRAFIEKRDPVFRGR
jgi:enoyl-CoA hydratase/carnithine racemase